MRSVEIQISLLQCNQLLYLAHQIQSSTAATALVLWPVPIELETDFTTYFDV